MKRAKELASSKKASIAGWAKTTISALEQMSPTGVHTTLLLLQKGANSTIKSALRNEMTLAQNYVERAEDLYTGIDAKLIKKTSDPKWQPAKLDDVDHGFIKELFAKPRDPIICKFFYHHFIT